MYCSCKITYDPHFPPVWEEGSEVLVILSYSVFAYLVPKLQHINKIIRVLLLICVLTVLGNQCSY